MLDSQTAHADAGRQGVNGSALASALIGLLSCLFVYLAPCRVRQGFPFGRREDVPELSQANLIEVLIDPACQAGCFVRVLRCHDLPLTFAYQITFAYQTFHSCVLL